MKKILLMMLTIFFIFAVFQISVDAESSNDDMKKLYIKFSIDPVYSELKGDRLYILTEHGPQNEVKYGENPNLFLRSGSEIGYYELNTGIYTKLFVKYFKDNTFGAIDYFRVDDKQENIDFTERWCVGRSDHNDSYYYTYSIKDHTATFKFLEEAYFETYELHKKAIDAVSAFIYDKKYFEYADKVNTLLKNLSLTVPAASTSNYKFSGNKLLLVKYNETGGVNYGDEIGYIDLDTNVYTRLLSKKSDSRQPSGEIKLLVCNGGDIMFEDREIKKDRACITYKYSMESRSLLILDSTFQFGTYTDTISNLKGKEIQASDFTDLNQINDVAQLLAISDMYPNIFSGVCVNSKVFVLLKSSVDKTLTSGQEFGSIDRSSKKYTRLFKKDSTISKDIQGNFDFFIPGKEFINFVEEEEMKSDKGNIYGTIHYMYSLKNNTLTIMNAEMTTAGNSIKLAFLWGKTIKAKDYQNAEKIFQLQKIKSFSTKYASIKEGFIKGDRLYLISKNGLNTNSLKESAYTNEIGYVDLKTNRYYKLLRKVKSTSNTGDLSFRIVNADTLSFYDKSTTNTDIHSSSIWTTTISYLYEFTGKQLMVIDSSSYDLQNLIGRKITPPNFKDIGDMYLNP